MGNVYAQPKSRFDERFLGIRADRLTVKAETDR
jgi:hypothetical protein